MDKDNAVFNVAEFSLNTSGPKGLHLDPFPRASFNELFECGFKYDNPFVWNVQTELEIDINTGLFREQRTPKCASAFKQSI